MKIIIIGGGYLGQLLHTIVEEARVFDWRPVAPTQPARSFGPQYLWTPIRALPCVSFQVITQIDGKAATPESMLAYKRKVGKELDASDWKSQFKPQMTGYDVTLPADRVEYGRRIRRIDAGTRELHMVNGERERYDWLISTIPLPALLQLCGHTPTEPFENRPIYVWTEPCAQSSYMTVNYISESAMPYYRVTTRDGQRHYESLEPPMGHREVGEGRAARLVPGKIYPHPDVFMLRASLLEQKIMLVGRYGSWDPEELAHETYARVRDWKERLQ